jgi:putative peptidoglycan lipid II flippase
LNLRSPRKQKGGLFKNPTLLKVESYKKGIVLSTIFNIFNKAIVFLNGILIAHYFGVQSGTDLVFYINNSVLILGAFVTSMNGTVVIPESMRIRVNEGARPAMAFLNFFIYLFLAFIITVIVIVIVSNPVSFFSAVSNFNHDDLVKNKIILYYSLPVFGMIFITNLLIDILTSHKFFTIPMIVGIINGSLSVIYVTVFHDLFGLKSVLYGLMTSYTLNIIILIWVMKRYLHWQFTVIASVKESRIWKNLGFAQLGNFTSTAASYMPMYILSGFNTGIITALTFAQQISTLPSSLITYQFSSVAGIKFNELYASNEKKEINRVFSEAGNFLHFLMVPLSCFIFFFADNIVEFLLGFTSLNESAKDYVTLFLQYLGFLLPLHVINSLMSRMFMASHKIKESFWYQILFNLLLITGLFLAVKYLGVIGYPLAMVAAYLLNILGCYLIEKKYFDFLNYKGLVENLGLILLTNIVISTGIYFVIRYIGIASHFPKLVIAFSLYLMVLVIVNNILKLNTSFIEQQSMLLGSLNKNKKK